MTILAWPVNAVAGAPAYSARDVRAAQSVYLAGASTADPFGARSGVRPGTSPATVTVAAGVWTIGAHAGVLDLQAAVEAAPYLYKVDAVGGLPTGATTAAHATLARTDIVWLRIDDPAEVDGSSVPAVVAGYTAGVASGSPAAPATPARCMVLAWVNVPASGGGSPTVTWKAPVTVAAGGILPASDSSGYPASPYVGQVCDNAALGYALRYNGSSWVATVDVFTGLEGALKGSVPPAGTRKIRYEGSIIYTTNAFGQFAVAFPAAFPNGIVSLIAIPGDTAANFGQAQIIRASTTLANGVGNAFTVTGAAINSLAICVNYVAIGW